MGPKQLHPWSSFMVRNSAPSLARCWCHQRWSCFCHVDQPDILFGIRGRPLMIWGGGLEEKLKMDLFFPWKCLLRIRFWWMNHQIFCLEKMQNLRFALDPRLADWHRAQILTDFLLLKGAQKANVSYIKWAHHIRSVSHLVFKWCGPENLQLTMIKENQLKNHLDPLPKW